MCTLCAALQRVQPGLHRTSHVVTKFCLLMKADMEQSRIKYEENRQALNRTAGNRADLDQVVSSVVQE
jgi:hypothetical protein